MLKYKRVNVTGLTAGVEVLVDMLSGMAGKNRRIVSINTEAVALDYLRVYRDAEQIMDCECPIATDATRWLPMDLPLAEGQQCKVGIYRGSALTEAEITIRYEEAG